MTNQVNVDYVTYHDTFHLSTNDGEQPSDYALRLSEKVDRQSNPEDRCPAEIYEQVGQQVLAKDGYWQSSSYHEWEYHPGTKPNPIEQ